MMIMQRDENTTQVNSFGKGMNTDLSYSMIGDGQYTFAKNIRITALNQSGQGDITNGQGAVRPIEGVTVTNLNIHAGKILATNSIRHIGIIVYTDADDNNYWKVGIFRNKIGSDEPIRVNTIYNSGEITNLDKFSTVVHYEAFNLVKLYIADGINPIKALNLTNGIVEEGEDFGNIQEITEDSVQQYPNIIFRPLKFRGLQQGGQLKAGMVQYAYLLYIKHGASTDMSPVTNLIPIVHPDTLLGDYQEQEVGASVTLNVTVDQEYQNVFDRIRVYRIYYPVNDQEPTISIFIDDDLQNILDNDGKIVDDGSTSLLDITIEEFNNMTGMHIIPKILESKNDILFAAATTDVQTAEFEDITDEDVTSPLEYEFIQIDLIGDASPAPTDNSTIIRHNTIQRTANDPDWKSRAFSYITGTELHEDILATVKNNNYTYSDPGVSYYARSLRRGETYRYGVVYYNERGESSGVTHITDVYVGGDGHRFKDLINPFTFDQYSKYELEVHPIGVKFYNIPIPKNAVAYEIVRCRRTEEDTHNLSQGVISRPVTKYTWNYTTKQVEEGHTHTPTGFLTMQDFYFGQGHTLGDDYKYINPSVRADQIDDDTDKNNHHADNYDNYDLIQFVSPEVCYSKDDFSSLVKGKNTSLHIIDSLYCDSGIRPHTYDHDGEFKVQYPAALHNANLFVHSRSPYAQGQLTLPCAIGVDYTLHPMTFYSAMPFNFATYWKDNFYPGHEHFTYITPTTQSIPDNIDWLKKTISGENDRIISKIKPYSFGYSKLYNCIQDPFPESNIKIKDEAVALELDNNATFTTNDSGETITNSYTSATVAVDTDSFCNCVIGGFYGENVNNYTSNTENAWEGSDDDMLFAANGGRCAVLKLEDGLRDTKLGIASSGNYYEDPRFMYTHLCNITQDVNPYGGNSDTAKKLSQFYSHGQYTVLTDAQKELGQTTRIVFDGDTYIQPMEYVSMHKQYTASSMDTIASSSMIYSIPVETSINLTYSCGYEYSRNIDQQYISNIQINPQNVYETLQQPRELYAYNMAYSSESKSKISASRTDKDDAELFKNMDYRVYYSNTKINGEYVDNWLHFDANNFIDVDTKHGPITHMRNFHNKLMFWQEKATGMLSVNERAVLSVNENTAENKVSKLPLVLGTGGVLERYDYLDDTTGMAPEQYCDTMSSSTLYWYDDNNKEIRAYTDGQSISPLSKVGGIQNLMHHYDDDNIPWMFYDQRYNEAVLDLQDDHKMSVAYNEQIRAFTSVYDIGFDGAIQFKNGLYLLNISDDNTLQIGEWNRSETPTGFDNPLISMIQYVVNKAPLITKVFDNQELVTIYGGEPYDKDSYFTEDHKYKWKTDLMDTGEIDNLQMTLREGNYRYAVPREGNAEYGSRMRGKYMICDIVDISPKKDASLAFVITKFRTSWI